MKTPFSIWIVTGDLNRRNPPAVISNIEPNRLNNKSTGNSVKNKQSNARTDVILLTEQSEVSVLCGAFGVYLTVCLSRDYAQTSLPIPNCMHECFFFRDHIFIMAFPFLVFNLAMCFLVIWPTKNKLFESLQNKLSY